MDISELNEDQVNKAFQLCDIMSIEDISLAIAILSSSNWNLEVHYILYRASYNK